MSCRTKLSRERCSAPCLRGLLVCGRHAKSKHPNLWKDVRSLEHAAKTIQTIWRGYFIRKQLSLAGPGVLKRSMCHNEEDMVTGVEKTQQNPFDYFAFEECGKIWWFDAVSILRWSVENVEIVNPYTKQPLPIEIRTRMRELYHLRVRMRRKCIIMEDEHISNEKIAQIRVNRLVQQMHECGFPDIRIDDFMVLSSGEIWTFTSFLIKDLHVLASEHPSPTSRRKMYISWMEEILPFTLRHFGYPELIRRRLFRTLIALFVDTSDTFPYCFVIASALYRV